MDNLQSPDDFRQLWLNRQPDEEDVEMVVTRALQDARKFQASARAYDIALVACYLLLLPLCLLVILYYSRESPLIAAGYSIWAVVLVSGLVAYRFFYRPVRGEPSPTGSSRDYIEHSIEYLNRRERFLTKSAIPVSALMAVAGIVFAVAAYRGQDALFQVILSFLGQPLGLWATLNVQRRYHKQRSRLREILIDFEAS